MTSGHLILEATFGALEVRLTSRQNMSVSARRALRDRLFVVRLHTSPPVGMVPAPGGQGAPNTFAALRTGLNKMLLQQRLAFHTMHYALASSQAMYALPLPPRPLARHGSSRLACGVACVGRVRWHSDAAARPPELVH